MKSNTFKSLHLYSIALFPVFIVLLLWQSIPASVCLHLNGAGACDNFLPKWFLFLLGIIGIALIGLLTYIGNHPEQLNMPDKKHTDLTKVNGIIQVLQYMVVIGTGLLYFVFLNKNNVLQLNSVITYSFIAYACIPLFIRKFSTN